MINPVHHARRRRGDRASTRSSRTWSPPTSTRARRTSGRGGWTWYTGSAGWMYRLIVESLLGLRLEGDTPALRRPACPPTGPSTSCTTATARPCTTSTCGRARAGEWTTTGRGWRRTGRPCHSTAQRLRAAHGGVVVAAGHRCGCWIKCCAIAAEFSDSHQHIVPAPSRSEIRFAARIAAAMLAVGYQG